MVMAGDADRPIPEARVSRVLVCNRPDAHFFNGLRRSRNHTYAVIREGMLRKISETLIRNVSRNASQTLSR
jgi:hypothetical protein